MSNILHQQHCHCNQWHYIQILLDISVYRHLVSGLSFVLHHLLHVHYLLLSTGLFLHLCKELKIG
ncbi:hypothetical protein LSH36_1489g00015 [Paralvinella palmiformis]|uniref:Uncharacterized protein n=1 Tax=Paralvinella palmiformis TaxID=53620 RepID=A0AAD9IT46_9ANNE|nr:hypothetical protein LSH36_1489g00015 [Paralvinella palmiformis]